jgi:acyl-CoA thioesterase-1
MSSVCFGPRLRHAVFASCIATLAVVGFGVPGSTLAGERAASKSPAPKCDAPAEFIRINAALPRTGQRIASGHALKIVAIGSSSTAGAGASSDANTYPSRLAAELKQHYPALPISVVNRGVNGEEANDMLARFEKNVLSENPDLVLWQVGTNSLLRDRPLEQAGALIIEGLGRLKQRGIDVVLVDAQYAPKVLAKPRLGELRHLMSTIAKRENVPTFQRFEVMRHWHEKAAIPFSAFLSPDGLHMNDWSYGCVAKLLAHAIVDAAARGSLTAHAGARR